MCSKRVPFFLFIKPGSETATVRGLIKSLPEPHGWTWWKPQLSAERLVCSAPSVEPTGRYHYTELWNAPSQGCPSCSRCECSSDSLQTGRERERERGDECTVLHGNCKAFPVGRKRCFLSSQGGISNKQFISVQKVKYILLNRVYTHWYPAEGLEF